MPGQSVDYFEREDRMLLESVPLLCGLPPPLFSALIVDQGPKILERATQLYHQGETVRNVHVVLSGWFKIFRVGEEGAETIIRIAGAGDVLCEADLLLQQGHQACAEAITQVRILSLNGSKLTSRMRRDPTLALRVVASLSTQVQLLTKHVEELKHFNTIQRTAQFLLNMCSTNTGACSLSLPFEKSVIAGWLGMKPASLSRALARLRRFGVTVDRDTISIRDARRLLELTQRTAEDELARC